MMSVLFAKIFTPIFAAGSCDHNFFFLPTWWKYLRPQPTPPDCAISFHFPGDIWLVGLAVLDMLLRLAGFLAVVSIIIAGARLITAEGNPEKGVAARNRLTNSLIGLAIAASGTAVVTLLGNTLGGGGNKGLPTVDAGPSQLQGIFNIAFSTLGALAFLFIVIAGLRMIIQGDNPTKVSEARRQIAYAAAGIILIALAAGIVNFILGALK